MANKKTSNVLKDNIERLDGSSKDIGLRLLSRLEFMERTLDELQNDIIENGAVIEAVNGNGFNVKNENPSQKSYVQMIGKFNALMKTIIDLLPSGNAQNDELMEFLKR